MASVVLGLLTGTILANARQRDLESSLHRLSQPVKSFLQSHPLVIGLTPVTSDELVALRQVLEEVLPDMQRGRPLQVGLVDDSESSVNPPARRPHRR
jgi:hypothetical protein